MLKGHPHKGTRLLLIGLAFLFGTAIAASAQIRTVTLESVGDSITCRIGQSTRKLTPDKFRIQFRATSKETQEFFEAVAPHTDLVSYLFVVPVTDTPNVEVCPADGGMNYIAYNANWLLGVYQDTNSKWTLYAIIAHEVGHFARGHDRISVGSNYDIELKADEYAGEVLAKMGASLPDSLAAFRSDKIGDHRGDDTHPPINERLRFVERGWRNIRGTETPTEGSAGAGGGSAGRPDPSKVEGALGDNIFEFWYVTFVYDAEGQGTFTNQESERYKVVTKPQVGQRYVWRGQNWRVYNITGSFVWLCNLDPAREEGAFGDNIFEFWYVTFDYNASGQGTARSRESKLYTVTQRPEINQRYVWQGQNWKVYTITGSRVWLSSLDPSRDEGAFGDNIYEFWYVLGNYKEAQRYTVKERPRIGQCYSWRDRDWKIYAITGSRVWLNECR